MSTQDFKIFPGEVFANADYFDTGIRYLLPGYDEMLNAIVRCIPTTSRDILELGCGTGELSLKILQHCPDARVTALDYSPRMLKFAREKITESGYQERWTGIEADFGEWANNPEKFGISGNFDACVSSLAIHHLADEMKLKLFQCIYQNLNSEGCFWNADPTLPESPALMEIYKSVGDDWAKQQGVIIADVRAKVGTSNPYGFSSQDQLATLDTHLQMLTQAGFETVAVPWKYYKIAVFGGWKQK